MLVSPANTFTTVNAMFLLSSNGSVPLLCHFSTITHHFLPLRFLMSQVLNTNNNYLFVVAVYWFWLWTIGYTVLLCVYFNLKFFIYFLLFWFFGFRFIYFAYKYMCVCFVAAVCALCCSRSRSCWWRWLYWRQRYRFWHCQLMAMMMMTLPLAVGIFHWISIIVWKLRDFEILQWNFEIDEEANGEEEHHLLVDSPRRGGIMRALACVISL